MELRPHWHCHRLLVLEVHARRAVVVTIRAHLDRHVSGSRGQRRDALELAGGEQPRRHHHIGKAAARRGVADEAVAVHRHERAPKAHARHRMHAIHTGERAVRVRDDAAVHGVIVEHAHGHCADRAALRRWDDAQHKLAARVRRSDRLGGAKLAEEPTRIRQLDARASDLHERAARHRPTVRVHAVRRDDLKLEAQPVRRVLLLALRHLDTHRASRMPRGDAVQLRRAAPRGGDRRAEPDQLRREGGGRF